MEYRLIEDNDIDDVIVLVNSTFEEYVKRDFDKEGIYTFYSLNSRTFYKEQRNMTYLAMDNQCIVGMMTIRDREHICLLFVDSKYHRMGIGEHLILIAEKLAIKSLSVNASPYGLTFYKKMGFKKINEQLCKDGIVYTPMKKEMINDQQFKSYDEVVDFINGQKDRVYSLDNFKNFMNYMCNPQLALKTLHIGGTNGKGSTTNYTKEVLKNAGYKVGTFTSPALVNRLDIIRVNDLSIKEEDMVKYANRYMQEWMQYEISMFEIEVFIAIMYFIDQGVDIAIFEVGLGGLLDATNIITPLLAVNTNIGLDHVDYLVHTYRMIAYNKAGIVKEGIDYMTSETKQECLDVFEEVCKNNHSRLIQIEEPLDIKDEQMVHYIYKGYDIHLTTSAKYQITNSALAINILEYIRSIFPFTDQQLINGLQSAHWAGRFEVIHQHPMIIIDGAHNKEGMNAFYQSAKEYNHIKVIFSALKDKDTHSMMELLTKLTDDVTVCEFDFYRAQQAELLAEDFPVKVEKDWKKAINQAYSHQGVVFITGSLYFISRVREYILENGRQR